MLRCGTTTCEAKSGYGLTTESELKMLRVIRALAAEQPIEIVADLHGRARECRPSTATAARAYVDARLSTR